MGRAPEVAGSLRARFDGTVTKQAAASHAADLQRQVPEQQGAGRDASDVSLGVRTVVSARARTAGPAHRAGRRLTATERRANRRRRWQQRRRQKIGSPQHRARMAEVADLDRRSALIGHLTAWLPAFAVTALAVAMTVNDPGFVYTTLRGAFDVPTSVGVLDVRNPDVLVALAAALAVTATLLAAARLAGRALGTLLFRGRLLQDDENPEAAAGERRMGPRQAVICAVIGLAVLAWFMVLLHSFAEARFTQDVTAAFSGAPAVNAGIVRFVTWLPAVVLAFEIVASAPQFEHMRKVSQWAVKARLAELLDVRRNQRQLQGEARAQRRARNAVITLVDVIGDVSIRGLAEAVEAALTTGQVPVTKVAEAYRTAPIPAAGQEGATAPSAVEFSGSPAGAYLSGLPGTSVRVADVLERFARLETVPDLAPMALAWHDLRAAPSTFCPVEGAHPKHLTCAGEPRTQPGAADLHGVPSGTPIAAEDEAA